jgi:hypothetical protein
VYLHIDIATALVLTALLILMQRDIGATVLRFRKSRPVLTPIGRNNLGLKSSIHQEAQNGQIEKAEQATIHSEEI